MGTAEDVERSTAGAGGLRKIIHIDMDAFYASVEHRDNPELRGKPVAVGGSRERGVVAAASYEARQFGVHSAMPSITAKRKCPDLIFVKPRFDAYKAISLQIREICRIHADHRAAVARRGLSRRHRKPEGHPLRDANRGRNPRSDSRRDRAHCVSRRLLQQVPRQTRLRSPQTGRAFRDHAEDGAVLETLPVRKFHGIGPATGRKMVQLGIETGLDLKGQTEGFLQQHFGKAGSYYYWAARGIDERPVRADRKRKSVGAANTFPADLLTYEAARDALREISGKVWGYCEGSGIRGRTVTLKVKFANFQIITRSRAGQMQVRTRGELEELGNSLLEPLFPVARGIRLLGISLSSLAAEQAEQPELSLPV
jgi:DNA polymerase-4